VRGLSGRGGTGASDPRLIRRLDPRLHPHLATPAAVAALSALLGVVVGVAWDRLAPHLEATVTSDGRLTGSATSPQAYFGAETWFLGLTVAAGILCALLAFVLLGTRTGSSLGTLLGLVLGGLAGALLAWAVGRSLAPATLTAHGAVPGSNLRQRVDLHAYGVLLGWPVAAAVVHVALTAGFGVHEPDREHQPG
jgi:hypothetical protein